MNKAAQLKIKDRVEDKRVDPYDNAAESDKQQGFLKQRLEDEIRMKLDRFAKELAQARKSRNK